MSVFTMEVYPIPPSLFQEVRYKLVGSFAQITEFLMDGSTWPYVSSHHYILPNKQFFLMEPFDLEHTKKTDRQIENNLLIAH